MAVFCVPAQKAAAKTVYPQRYAAAELVAALKFLYLSATESLVRIRAPAAEITPRLSRELPPANAYKTCHKHGAGRRH